MKHILNLDPEFVYDDGIGELLKFDHKIFPGGEPHFKLHSPDHGDELVITQRIDCAEDLMLLLVAQDAVCRSGLFTSARLILPYFPGARQDRVCDKGEALTAGLYAALINQLGYTSVTICSPHSEVVPALLHRAKVRDVDLEFCGEVVSKMRGTSSEVNIVCPDAGAGKRVFKIAERISANFKVNLIRCEKVRDVRTGNITEFFVAATDLGGLPTIVFDDIVAMGGTFLGLADELRKRNCGDLGIFTCHADCEKGVDNLLTKFSHVFTTNSKRWTTTVEKPNFTVFKLV